MGRRFSRRYKVRDGFNQIGISAIPIPHQEVRKDENKGGSKKDLNHYGIMGY